MKHDAFLYEFTFKEFWYFLFGRKRCPDCEGQLVKEKTYETRQESEFQTRRGRRFFHNNAKVKYYIYKYRCTQCNALFSLKELANGKKGDIVDEKTD